MMNIQRYKWPVIVAASLHGALFMGHPHSSLVSNAAMVKSWDLPPLPEKNFLEIMQPAGRTSEDILPNGGACVVPELLDVVMSLPEKTVFLTPVVEHPRAEKYDDSLKNHRVPTGSGLDRISGVVPDIIDSTKLDRQPRATAQMSPDYPATMRQQRITGTVMVEFDVNIEGKVVRAEVAHATRREFAEAALRAVRNWHFEPGKRNARAVPFRMMVPIEFGLGAD